MQPPPIRSNSHHLQLLLGVLQDGADRGLGDVQVARRRGDRAGAHDRVEGFQLPQSHHKTRLAGLYIT
jgi:hypothetical protein